MRLFKKHYNLSLPKNLPRSAPRGQALVEFVVVLPILLAFLSVGYDFTKVAYTQHRVTQATYEAVKMIAQISGAPGTFDVTCTPGVPPAKPCLSEAVISRAKRTLEEAGVDIKNPDFKIEFIDKTEDPPRTTPQGKVADRFLGLRVEVPYSFALAAGIGKKTLVSEMKTFYEQVKVP